MSVLAFVLTLALSLTSPATGDGSSKLLTAVSPASTSVSKRRKLGAEVSTERTAARTRYASIALIDATDLAAMLGVSVWTLGEWVDRGLIPPPFSMVPGGPRQWRVSDINFHIDKRKRSRRPRQSPRGAVKARLERKRQQPARKRMQTGI